MALKYPVCTIIWFKSNAVDLEDQRDVIAQQVEKSSIFHIFIFEYFLLTIIIIHCISVHPL